MFPAPEQLTEFNKAALDTTFRFAKASFDAAERLVSFNFEAGRAVFADTAKTARALVDVRDVQDYSTWRAKSADASAEKAMTYAKGLYDIAQQAQAELSGLVEERFAEMNKQVATTLDKAMKAAPAGADVIVAAIKSSVAAGTAAVDSMTKAAKQAASFADAGIKATANATAAASKASRK